MTYSPFELSLSGMLKSALILSPPAMELLLLHAVASQYLGPNNATFGIYGRDVLYPLFFGFFLCLCYLQRESELFCSFSHYR